MVKVAGIQVASREDSEASLDKMIDLADLAVERGAQPGG
jgi:hypothetical protein